MILNIHYCVENFAFLRLGGMELLLPTKINNEIKYNWRLYQKYRLNYIVKDSMLLAKLNSCYNMEQLWLFCSVGLDNLTGSFTEEI